MVTKILISDPLAKEGLDILKHNREFIVDVEDKLSEKVLIKKIKGYDALIVRSGTTVTKKVIDSANKLKIIGRAGVGLDNVDVKSASEKGIVVMNAPTSNTISTAEHAFSLMLSLARKLPSANQSVKEGHWERKKFRGIELYGKTLGIIGLGRIGVEFAKRAVSFGMKILAFDPFLSEDKAKSLDVEPVTLDRLFKFSDFITIHTPLTEETWHLIDEKAFSKMKRGVRIINAARGGIIDEDALAKNIKSGKVAGAALDVFETKAKPPVDSPVVGLEQVITTPHLGSSTDEAQINVAIDIAKCVVDGLSGKVYKNAVNMPVVPEEMLSWARPYMDLAEKMGSIQTQLIEEPIESIKVKYAGGFENVDVAVITQALVKGVFSPILEGEVNYVNSLFIAKERGVNIAEKKTFEIKDFADLICVEINPGKNSHLIMGTLFANKVPRIVRINEFYLEAIPEGTMLVIANNDVPGIVGKVGTIIGKAGVNIAGISLGRNRAKKKAISLINLDNGLPRSVITELAKIKGITSVKQILI